MLHHEEKLKAQFSIKCCNSEQKGNSLFIRLSGDTQHFHGAWLFLFSFCFFFFLNLQLGHVWMLQAETAGGSFSFFVPESNSINSITQVSLMH